MRSKNIGEECVPFVPAVEPDLVAEETGGDANSNGT
jgi:hypothetical protein